MARFLLKVPRIDAISLVESNMNPHKILIVDDDPVIVTAMSMKLRPAGYQVLSAADGSAAISAARKEKPDLILLDLNFPNDIGLSWDGFQIIAWLQRVDEAKKTPVIIVSGGDPAKFKNRALQAGAIAYLQKPIKNDELLALIKQTLAAPAQPPQAHNSPV